MSDASPFSDIRDLLDTSPAIPTVDPDTQIDPQYLALGRLARLSDWISRVQGKGTPKLDKVSIAIFAGAHGVASDGVSLLGPGTDVERVNALREGKSPTNTLAGDMNATVRVFDLALEQPTPHIAQGAALSERDCAATIAFGMEALEGLPDCLALGALGIGGSTIAAAVACGLFGGDAGYWVRAGAGVPSEIHKKRVRVITDAIAHHSGQLNDPLEVLRRLGGREIAALVGAIIAARHQRVPVVLDGFSSSVAAAVLHQINPVLINHVIAGHVSPRPAHVALLERIGKAPVLDLHLGIGEAVGATVALGLLKNACLLDQ